MSLHSKHDRVPTSTNHWTSFQTHGNLAANTAVAAGREQGTVAAQQTAREPPSDVDTSA